MKKKYFHNLNGLRFVLAAVVIVQHIEALKYWNGIESIYPTQGFIKTCGTTAVSFFFALSGFLISYFLMIEKRNKEKQTINVKSFYFSRFLRIWPLYFFTILLFFVILPNLPFGAVMEEFRFMEEGEIKYPFEVPSYVYVILSLVLLPQLGLAISAVSAGTPMPAGHTWSIGVEEIFYLTWPVLLKRSSNYKRMMLRIVIIYYTIFFVFVGVYVFNDKILHKDILNPILSTSILFLFCTRIVCMIIGAYGAHLYITNKAYLDKHITFPKALFALLLILGILYKGVHAPVLVQEILCVCFIVILLYLVQDNRQNVFLEHRFISYLGKISYGLYMYHMFAISWVLYVVKNNFEDVNSLGGSFCLYLFSFAVTIAISAISYHLFEARFLQLKRKYVK